MKATAPVCFCPSADTAPAGATCVSLEALAESPQAVRVFPQLSPDRVGPVTVYPGARAREATSFGVVWHALQLGDADAIDGRPTKEHALRLLEALKGTEEKERTATSPIGILWRGKVVTDDGARAAIGAALVI